MKPIDFVLSLTLIAPSLMSCAGNGAPTDLRAAPDDQAQISESPSSNQDVALLLSRGYEAEAHNDAQGLMQIAEQLMRLEARPLEGIDLADQWFSRAKDLGANYAPAPIMRGRATGPGYRNGRIGPNGQFVTRQNFYAGQRAEIIIVPLDGGRLSLQVSNDEGRSLCHVAASARNLGCRFVPVYTGANMIEVYNDTDVPVNFYMVLN